MQLPNIAPAPWGVRAVSLTQIPQAAGVMRGSYIRRLGLKGSTGCSPHMPCLESPNIVQCDCHFIWLKAVPKKTVLEKKR